MIRHTRVLEVPDQTEPYLVNGVEVDPATVVQPSHWNDDHAIDYADLAQNLTEDYGVASHGFVEGAVNTAVDGLATDAELAVVRSLIPILPTGPINEWQPEFTYENGDLVQVLDAYRTGYAELFSVISETPAVSGSNPPAWNLTAPWAETQDNDIIWQWLGHVGGVGFGQYAEDPRPGDHAGRIVALESTVTGHDNRLDSAETDLNFLGNHVGAITNLPGAVGGGVLTSHGDGTTSWAPADLPAGIVQLFLMGTLSVADVGNSQGGQQIVTQLAPGQVLMQVALRPLSDLMGIGAAYRVNAAEWTPSAIGAPDSTFMPEAQLTATLTVNAGDGVRTVFGPWSPSYPYEPPFVTPADVCIVESGYLWLPTVGGHAGSTKPDFTGAGPVTDNEVTWTRDVPFDAYGITEVYGLVASSVATWVSE